MKKDFCFEIAITLEAPVISQAQGAIGLGLDAAMLRDSEGHAALPGSLIRGNIRHCLEFISGLSGSGLDRDLVEEWFGSKSEAEVNDENLLAGGSYSPNRAVLNFSQWWKTEKVQQSNTVHRIAIDSDTGSVKKGALQFIESLWPSGTNVTFVGNIQASLNSDSEASTLARWLTAGLKSITSIGALKGVGFGRLVNVDVTRKQIETLNVVWPVGLERVGLRLSLDRPLCIGKPAVGENNRFDTEDHIPGAAIIAAIASRVNSDPEKWPGLSKNINQLHCSHAQPVESGDSARPAPVLQSMVFSGASELYDLGCKDGPGLLNGEAPVFPIDWKNKHWAMANKWCGRVSPNRRLDIKTAIDSVKGVAKESQLFSMESVEPAGHEWLCNLDMGKLDDSDKDEVRNELERLLSSGIWPIGKTKCHINVGMEDDNAMRLESPYEIIGAQAELIQDGIAVISLLTPALLLDNGIQLVSSNNGNLVADAYRRAWSELSGGALNLIRHFSYEQLHGGRYWWGRFGNNQWGSNYHPQVLTKEGSVFVLEVVNGNTLEAEKVLTEWKRYGLPQLRCHPDTWEHNPWIRQNGYGEIAVNLRFHKELEPSVEKGGWNGISR